jgi:hypothetical protein
VQFSYLADLSCSSIYLIYWAVVVNSTGMNLRGSPGYLRDQPSSGDLPITRIQATVVRKRGMVFSTAVIKLVRNLWKHEMNEMVPISDTEYTHSTGDSRYTRFCYQRFRISAVLFQQHEEHQYTTRGQILKRRTFSRLIRECDADVKISIKQFWRQFNTKMAIPVLRVFVTSGDSQEHNPRV